MGPTKEHTALLTEPVVGFSQPSTSSYYCLYPNQIVKGDWSNIAVVNVRANYAELCYGKCVPTFQFRPASASRCELDRQQARIGQSRMFIGVTRCRAVAKEPASMHFGKVDVTDGSHRLLLRKWGYISTNWFTENKSRKPLQMMVNKPLSWILFSCKQKSMRILRFLKVRQLRFSTPRSRMMEAQKAYQLRAKSCIITTELPQYGDPHNWDEPCHMFIVICWPVILILVCTEHDLHNM